MTREDATSTNDTIRLLLVEDKEDDALLLQKALDKITASHFEIECVQTLADALSYLQGSLPDAVLLDLMLPDCAGLDTLSAVHSAAPSVPIVVLTALSDERLAAGALQEGAQDYLVKGDVKGDLIYRSIRYATERKRAEQRLIESESRYRRLVEHASDAIFVTDLEGNFLEVNSKTCEMGGYSREEMLRLNIRDIIIPEEYARIPPRFEELRAGRAVLSERIARRKDGTLLLVEVNARMFDDRHIEGIARDITQRRAAEEEIRRLSEDLERRIAERTAQLEQVNRELQREIAERTSVEEELRRSRDQLNVILQGVADGISVQKADGEIVYANDAAARTLGFDSAAELLSTPVSDVMRRYEMVDEDGNPFPYVKLPGRRALMGETAHDTVVGWRLVDSGETRWSIVKATPVLDESGRVQFAISIFREITEAKHAQESLQTRAKQQAAVAWLGQRALLGGELSELFDEAVELLARTLDVELAKVLKLVPPGDYLLLVSGVGWHEGVVGKALVSTGPESQVGYVLAAEEPVIVRELKKETRFRGTPLLHQHDVISGMSVMIHGTNGPFGVLGAHTSKLRNFTEDDIHFMQAIANVLAAAIERKRAEDALRASEERFRELSASLQAANKELEAFSYSVSHDLRAPLRAINGYATALLEEEAQILSTEGAFYLERIGANARQMGELIDDLLSFSRLARQQIERTEINIGELATYVFEELELTFPEKERRFHAGDAPPAKGDWAMVRLVLQNLLQNALKFSKDREVPDIEVSGRPGEGGYNVYWVKDNGIGFDPRYTDKLFGVFQRLHPTGEFEGTGVGLALVQRIVYRHGGTVWAQSRPGEGATFYFTLPTLDPDQENK